MPAVHDPTYCSALHSRADQLTQESARQWGTMTPDQMLWHVNASLSVALGKLRAAHQKPPLPAFIFRSVALYFPWPKGKAPALPETIAASHYNLNEERQRFHTLLDEFAARPLHFNWLEHPSLGRLSGPSWSRFEAKHLDHHFRQFGV